MISAFWQYRLQDRNGTPIGNLDRVTGTGGSLTGNVAAQVRWTGTLDVEDPHRYNWHETRLAPVLHVNGAEIPFGVYLVKVEERDGDDINEVGTLRLFDRTLVVAEDVTDQTETVPAGANVTDWIRNLILSTGETRVSISGLPDTLRTDLVFDPGTTKLTMINELGRAVGMFALWTDFSGTFRVEPYSLPQERAPQYTFRPSRTSIHRPQWSARREATVHNRVVVMSQETADMPAMVATAENTDPASPDSYQAQGRWVTRFEQGVEATSQNVLNLHAARLLAEENTGGEVMARKLFPTPFTLNGVVLDGDGRREVVENMKLDLTDPLALMEIQSRRVND